MRSTPNCSNLLEQRFAAIEKIRVAKRQAGEDSGLADAAGARGDHSAPSRWSAPRASAAGPHGASLAIHHVGGDRRAGPHDGAHQPGHHWPTRSSFPACWSSFRASASNVAEEAAVVAAIAGTSSDIAILPREGSWMESFEGGGFGEARVIGCLPLLSPRDRAPDLLIFGHARVERTGERSHDRGVARKPRPIASTLGTPVVAASAATVRRCVLQATSSRAPPFSPACPSASPGTIQARSNPGS